MYEFWCTDKRMIWSFVCFLSIIHAATPTVTVSLSKSFLNSQKITTFFLVVPSQIYICDNLLEFKQFSAFPRLSSIFFVFLVILVTFWHYHTNSVIYLLPRFVSDELNAKLVRQSDMFKKFQPYLPWILSPVH